MTTTELIKLLKMHEKNAAGESRKVSIDIDVEAEKQLLLDSSYTICIDSECLNDEELQLLVTDRE